MSRTSDALAELLKRTTGDGLDASAMITALEQKGVDASEALGDLWRIEAFKARHEDRSEEFGDLWRLGTHFDWLFAALVGLRTLADKERLREEDVKPLWEGTERFGAQLGMDEFYRTIGALARSRKTAPALLEVVDDLLHRQNIREWWWLALTAVAEIASRKTAEIPPILRQDLDQKVRQQETDRARLEQAETLLKQLEASS